MPVLIALLRGVNLGGHNRIAMAELRKLCEPLKFRDAQTYLQSGNLIFTTAERDNRQIAAKLQNAIQRRFACRPEIILRTQPELAEVVRASPFTQRRGLDPAKLLVSFLSGEPSPEARARLDELKGFPEEFCAMRRELYIYFPNGLGKSRFPWATLHRLLGVEATGRNWNTVLKLHALATASCSRK